MILQRLCEYYDRIAADPSVEIAQAGYAPQKISFEVVINTDASLAAVNDIRESSGKKPTPRTMRLPFEKRTSGVKAMFLWDKAEYLLGYVPKDLRTPPENEAAGAKAKREKKIARVRDCFVACQSAHVDVADRINSSDFQTLCDFLSRWTPESLTADHAALLDDVGTGFGVFRVNGNTRYVHEISEICEFWTASQAGTSASDLQGICLISGATTSLARLHPVIKGVRDAQSSGASIVSFNKSAFESFGKTQSFNSPVSEEAAFKYSTALNHLLDKKSGRKLQVGDATCVFWADRPSVAEDIFNFGLDPGRFEDESRANEIGNLLHRTVEGEAVVPDQDVGFHVLGLSPNASRLSVRFWISGTAIEMIARVAAHQQRLEIARAPNDLDVIPLWLILAQTARESKEIQPLLGGALLRSVLTGGKYPISLLSAIVRRIRAEQDIRHIKAAAIKAVLNHNHDKEISVMLDVERSEDSYHLGRLFACLERAQEDALPGLNATIKDRYFGAASATPATVFPRLVRLSQHHLAKLDGGKKVVAERRIQEVIGRVNAFPRHLGLVDQGLFAIGYYHQRQDFFTKKPKAEEHVAAVAT